MPLLNPAFLWAVAAVSVPLWLHLSRRRVFKEVTVGTLRFLRTAMQRRRKRSRLEEIPLLLLRMAAVALLALLFARPFQTEPVEPRQPATETLVLLDASGSITADMAQTARRAAEKIINAADDDSVTLAQFADTVQVIESTEDYAPRPGAPTRLAEALGWALDRFAMQSRLSGRVVVVTHAPASALPSDPPRVWPPELAVEMVALAPQSPDNAAVRQVSLLTPYAGEEMEVEAVVSLPRNAKNRTVTFEAEGLSLASELGQGRDRVLFRFHPPRDEIRGTVAVEALDLWPVDDRRPFVVQWTQPKRLLIIDGRPGSTPFEGQAYYVHKALAASGAAHGKSPFKPEIGYGLSGRQGDVPLDGIAAVALCGDPALTTDDVRRLAAFVAGGGGLLVVPGDRWHAGATSDLTDAGLFPEVFAATGGEARRSIAEWDRGHPALAEFDGRDGGDLRSLEWRDGFALAESVGWKPLATLDGGHILLAEKSPRPEGSGPVMVWAHPLNRDWSEVPRDPLFVPLVKNIFDVLSGFQGEAANAPILHPGLTEIRTPGVYPGSNGTIEIVAAAADESDMGAATAPLIRAAYGLPEVDRPAGAARGAESAGGRLHSRPRELWPWVLVVLVVLLVVENVVATRRPPLMPAARPAAVSSVPRPETASTP
jgi:hypothetical protein